MNTYKVKITRQIPKSEDNYANEQEMFEVIVTESIVNKVIGAVAKIVAESCEAPEKSTPKEELT